MNRLRKILNRSERRSVNTAKKEPKYDAATAGAAGAAPTGGNQFFSIEEARSWVQQNRTGITGVQYVPGYAAESYPEPSITAEEGASLVANPELNLSQLRYSRLEGRAIRLLMLESGQGFDDICGRLEENSLDSAAAYEALSYAWGDSAPRYSFKCNGSSILIASSLHRALWQFRELGLLGPFWIDAVCINQADIREKTEQVKMMRSVYEKAALVRIWLGKASNDTEEAVVLLTRAYQVLKARQKNPDPAEAYISITSFGIGEVAPDDILMLWNFYAHVWFDRSWVVQELTVAAKAVFQTGIFEIESEILLTVATALSKTLPGSYAMEASVPWSKVESLKPFLFPASVFSDVKQQYDSGRSLKLSELIRRTAQLKATEPHDKIFAFVGLASDRDLSMINYSTPIRDLHLAIAKNALMSQDKAYSEGIDFLSQVRTYLDSREPTVEEPEKKKQLGLDCPLSDQDLPSWAPDLTRYDNFFENSIVPLSSIFPSSSVQLKTTPDIRLLDGEILVVRGKLLDAAHTFFHSFPYRFPARFTANRDTMDTLLHQIAQWPLECSEFLRKHGLYADEGGSYTRPVFARTLVFNAAFGDERTHHSPDRRYYKAFHAWCVVLGLVLKGHRSNGPDGNIYAVAAEGINKAFREESLKAEANGDPSDPLAPDITAAEVLMYATTFDKLARGRKFGFTRRRTIGWFPECARDGDAVFLFDGSRLPFLLRYYEERDAFKIVGDCCLHPFMYDGVFKEMEMALKEKDSEFVKIC